MKALSILALLVLGQSREQMVRNNRAALLLDVGRFEEAESEFRELLGEGFPSEVGLGIALRSLGKPEEALWCFAGSGDLEQEAATLHALGRELEAAGVYGRLLSSDPLTLFNLGAAWRDTGWPHARSIFEEVASRCSARDTQLEAEVLYVLADEARLAGDYEQARRIAAQADYLTEGSGQWLIERRCSVEGGPRRRR